MSYPTFMPTIGNELTAALKQARPAFIDGSPTAVIIDDALGSTSGGIEMTDAPKPQK